MVGMIGKKLGMTQMYKESGILCPTTAIELGPCPIVQVKTADGKDGYNALKLGFWESKKISKPELGVFAKVNLAGMKVTQEFRMEDTKEYAAAGMVLIRHDVFTVGDNGERTGHARRAADSPGAVTSATGSPEARIATESARNTDSQVERRVADPSRVFKGKKLPGHYGNARQTVPASM